MSDDSCTPAPDPEAGQDGNGEQQLTEEERMLKEIAELKGVIDALPDGTPDGEARRAPYRKKLGQLEFKYHLSVEKKRLARAMTKFEEKYGALYSEPCLLCLDDIHVHATGKLVQFFICCGGLICMTCALDIKKSGKGLGKCPLCREPLAQGTPAGDAAKLMILAERGVAWAQTDVGRRMVFGVGGFKRQEKTGLEWTKKAAAQDYPPALHSLATLYRKGMASVLRKSEEKAKQPMMKSANLGYATANSLLAESFFYGSHGFDRDHEEAYFRASVALALDDSVGQAAEVLGRLHCGALDGEGNMPESSPYLACYYLNISANSAIDDGSDCLNYSQALIKLSGHLHGRHLIPGFNVVPAAFFWSRKSSDLGFDDAGEQLKKWESVGQSHCDNCQKDAQPCEKFKQCSKCKAQWYCSKECQVEAWKAGHKKDCKRASILKFEDYLNAE